MAGIVEHRHQQGKAKGQQEAQDGQEKLHAKGPGVGAHRAIRHPGHAPQGEADEKDGGQGEGYIKSHARGLGVVNKEEAQIVEEHRMTLGVGLSRRVYIISGV